jgi:hypothetical protein
MRRPVWRRLQPVPFAVGLVATYAKWKGHETFLEAVSRLGPAVPVRAYVVGGPAYQVSASQWTRADLNRRASELGLDGPRRLSGLSGRRVARVSRTGCRRACQHGA